VRLENRSPYRWRTNCALQTERTDGERLGIPSADRPLPVCCVSARVSRRSRPLCLSGSLLTTPLPISLDKRAPRPPVVPLIILHFSTASTSQAATPKDLAQSILVSHLKPRVSSRRQKLTRLSTNKATMSAPAGSEVTLENIAQVLEHDTKVKVAGVDVDGILRGKLISKKKFLSIAQDGFGFCSVIFGWDMHDRTYFKELKISNKENGYRDILAIPDLRSFRRIPWEDNVPFFLVSFFDPNTKKPLCACPRGLLKTAVEKLEKAGCKAMAGGMRSSKHPVFPERLFRKLIQSSGV